MTTNPATPLHSIRPAADAPQTEAELRVELAAAYRLVALHGWDDLIFTHLSARVPGTDHFLINPYGLLFEEITASSLVKVDLEGNKLDDSPYPVNPAGFTIHSAVHSACPDAHCVIHLHTVQGQAVSAQAEGLLPLTQTALQVIDDVAYHDFEGIAEDLGERERIVADLCDKHLLILRNHGTLTFGETVADAWLRMYMLERACEAQIAALTGGRVMEPCRESREKTAQIAQAGLTTVGRKLAWPALQRKLDRIDPSYRD
ncbi:MAG: class II aldolase/adducin family protein [Myxococcota bacterium]